MNQKKKDKEQNYSLSFFPSLILIAARGVLYTHLGESVTALTPNVEFLSLSENYKFVCSCLTNGFNKYFYYDGDHYVFLSKSYFSFIIKYC